MTSYKYIDLESGQTEILSDTGEKRNMKLDFNENLYSRWEAVPAGSTGDIEPIIEKKEIIINSEKSLKWVSTRPSLFGFENDTDQNIYILSKFQEVQDLLEDERFFQLLPNYIDLDSTYKFYTKVGRFDNYRNRESYMDEVSKVQSLYKESDFIKELKNEIEAQLKSEKE